jgi:hypothetical protein
VIHSIFAIEVCLPLDTALLSTLRGLILEHPERSGYQEKWLQYRQASQAVAAHAGRLVKGCWDYFDDDTRALRDYDMWVAGMTTEEGARTEPSGESDPYRGTPRYMTLTMAFLLVQNSPTDMEMSTLCNVPAPLLWKRDTFARILEGIGALSFASVKSDVIYVIPGDRGWGLTEEDLAQSKFEYLRTVL